MRMQPPHGLDLTQVVHLLHALIMLLHLLAGGKGSIADILAFEHIRKRALPLLAKDPVLVCNKVETHFGFDLCLETLQNGKAKALCILVDRNRRLCITKQLIFQPLFLSRNYSQIIMRLSKVVFIDVSSYQFYLLMTTVSIILIMHGLLFSHYHCILSTYLNHHKLITTKQTTRSFSKFIFYPNSCFFSVYLNKIQYINVTCLEYDPFMYP